jgi:hypothetical protein
MRSNTRATNCAVTSEDSPVSSRAALDRPGAGRREQGVARRAGAWCGATRRLVAIAAALLVVTTACSSDDNSGDPPTTATPAPSTTAATSTTPSAAPPTSSAPAATAPATSTSVAAAAATPPRAAAREAAPAFPVKVSENSRYLVDQDGRPWMMNGDSPQCLSANLSVVDMDFFFANRAGHGFNAAWVNLLCGPYTHGRDDASTFDRIKPFTNDKDLSTPNPAYWERMDTMVDLAGKHGITLVLDPAETGTFAEWLKDNGAEKSRAYGQFLGRRYRDELNIIWMLGNDYREPDKYDEYVTALSKGIREADPAKLQTVELTDPVSTSYDDPSWPSLIDLNAAYAYTPTYAIVRRAYIERPTKPVFMVESNYEYENNDGGPAASDEGLRRQEYWTMTSGATGQLYGNKYTWGLEDTDWKQHFDTPAVDQYTLMASFFGERAWQDLVPDLDDRFLTKGAGDAKTEGDVLDSELATDAVTPDGRLAVVYIPTSRTVEVDVSRLDPNVKARWFDPTDGTYRDAKAPYTTPGKNSAGDEDWVLVFDGG